MGLRKFLRLPTTAVIDLLFVLAPCLVVAGVAMLSIPAGLITAGFAMEATLVLYLRGANKDESR